jgi:hypothetical protein
MFTRCVFLATFVTLGIGCSGASPIPLDQFCERYSKTLCDAAQRCGCLSDLEATYCPTYLAGQCQTEVVTPAQSGTRAYDSAAAGHCLAGYGAVLSDCSIAGDSAPTACDDMLVGTLAAGQACESDSDCQPGLECHSSVCTVMPGQGEACLDESYCAEDLFCAADGTCQQPRGRGGACPEGGQACADELYCDSVTETCQPPLGAGESCAADSWACGDGLYCADTTQTCTRNPGAGGDCAVSSGECADGTYCDSTDVCQPQQDQGAACTADDECKSDYCANDVCSGGSGDVCGIVG